MIKFVNILILGLLLLSFRSTPKQDKEIRKIVVSLKMPMTKTVYQEIYNITLYYYKNYVLRYAKNSKSKRINNDTGKITERFEYSYSGYQRGKKLQVVFDSLFTQKKNFTPIDESMGQNSAGIWGKEYYMFVSKKDITNGFIEKYFPLKINNKKPNCNFINVYYSKNLSGIPFSLSQEFEQGTGMKIVKIESQWENFKDNDGKEYTPPLMIYEMREEPISDAPKIKGIFAKLESYYNTQQRK